MNSTDNDTHEGQDVVSVQGNAEHCVKFMDTKIMDVKITVMWSVTGEGNRQPMLS